MTTAKKLSGAAPLLDVARIREDFPILHQQVHGKDLVYLDNAATSQKPRAVIEATDRYYREYNANIHRGVHALSGRATEAYEAAREKTRAFLNGASSNEIVFLRGATEGINLVAQSWGRANVGPGDEILVTTMEHHSNIVPWKLLCDEKGATLRVVPINERGELEQDAFAELLSPRTKLVGVVHVSNALGTVNPVGDLIAAAHEHGAVVLVDGAQAAPHLAIDVQALDADFYVFSGHKAYGPTGSGALYGKKALLDAMPPWQGGGEMIASVSFDEIVYNRTPHKFEAGTPNIAGAVGLGAAIDYIQGIGLDAIDAYEHQLLSWGNELLAGVPGLTMVGTADNKAAVLSFTLDGVHPHDVGTILDQEGIAVRTGHHCAQPVMTHFGIPATTRASLAFYNTREELEALAAGLRKVIEVFA